MAIARTGVYLDDYLEYSSTLPAELQRILSTMRELDVRSRALINLTRDQTRSCLGSSPYSSKKLNHEDDEAELEKIRREIESNQENALSLCTEKVLLARQAYDLIDSHVKRLDEDLNQFAEDLKQEGKLPANEPAILPPLPIHIKDEKRKSGFFTPQSKRTDFRERDWDRERDRDLELMPPPGSHKKNVPETVDADQPIDPNEPTYCVCHQVSFGDMIACDNENIFWLNNQIDHLDAEEENGFITRVLASHLKPGLKGNGTVLLADCYNRRNPSFKRNIEGVPI